MTQQLRQRTVLSQSASTTRSTLSFRSLALFFALTFGIGWGAPTFLLVFPEQTTAIFGEMGYTNPVFLLAVYSPAIAGLFLVWRHHGLRGVGRFLRRLTLWRMPAAWWLLLIGLPAAYYLGAALKGTLADPFPFSPWYGVLPALALALVIGPIEELGWRGVALPLLQRRFAPLWAGLILGAIWGVWHVPAFFLSGTPQSAWSLGPFLIGVVAVSVILTVMFNAARGSLLIAALFHFQLNGPAWPDAQPWDMLLFGALAVIIVLLNRRSLLDRHAAVTEVLPGAYPDKRDDAHA